MAGQAPAPSEPADAEPPAADEPTGRTHVWEPGPDPDVPDTPSVAEPLPPASRDRRALPWGLLAAMLVAGLAVGFVAGRWTASPSSHAWRPRRQPPPWNAPR